MSRKQEATVYLMHISVSINITDGQCSLAFYAVTELTANKQLTGKLVSEATSK